MQDGLFRSLKLLSSCGRNKVKPRIRFPGGSLEGHVYILK